MLCHIVVLIDLDVNGIIAPDIFITVYQFCFICVAINYSIDNDLGAAAKVLSFPIG